jgi:hypothetical protein
MRTVCTIDAAILHFRRRRLLVVPCHIRDFLPAQHCDDVALPASALVTVSASSAGGRR